ncbi:3-deoxy-D-manno-octulosonic acid kinase [Aliiglaciecola sp. CAU 1673]|uniref:3-deoxy-D-manno-octulosonic acid kinase n=1 Tax=Aliiglaciecola sp. CAU 1673 TaxID=3032595 RepID=UPI0023D9F657|nr:3-deoxy-D-manno-octulosonic acid kinase [Aliiglaciecola sp. CAU 1673]MDF2179273.1 3-deoxy-D-manno-octulosonic acid kinase [Aliiglaciecola sp. CAU 1673]
MSALTYGYQDDHHFLFDPSWFTKIEARHFAPSYWLEQGAVLGQAQGRGTTYFVRYDKGNLVLRHYRRGGIPGKLLTDQYLYPGLEHTRPWRELKLLSWMQSQGLPVPTPVAAHVHRSGLIYRGDILLSMIPNSHDLHRCLCEGAVGEDIWQEVGRVIAKMHALQVCHSDLNIHNLMLDDSGKIWLIDFDRCEKRQGQGWKKDNLARLKRSLEKEQGRMPDYHWQAQQWSSLMAGYNEQTGC